MLKSPYISVAILFFSIITLARDLRYIIADYVSTYSFSVTVIIGLTALIAKIVFTICVYIYFCKKVYESGCINYDSMNTSQISGFRTLFNMIAVLGIVSIGDAVGLNGVLPILAILALEVVIYLLVLLIFNFFTNAIIKKSIYKNDR